MEVRSLMRRAVQYFGKSEAVSDENRRFSFEESWERGLRLGNWLLALENQPGDRVGVLEENSVPAVDSLLGTTACNLVRVPLYPLDSMQAQVHMLRHTDCRTLIADDRYKNRVEALREELPNLKHVIVREKKSYETRLSEFPALDPNPEILSEDIYIIRHTGGTTGRPKGVAYTNWSWLASGRDWFYGFPPVEPGDACLHVGPISHGSGYFFTPVWLAGGRNVLCKEFEPPKVLSLMEREEIAYMFAVPTMLNRLLHESSATERDWSKLKVVCVAAAPISERTALQARDTFGPVLYQVYGQTEALPATVMTPETWFSNVPGSKPLRSAGRPYPFAVVEIWDPDSHEPVGLNEVGEIVVRTDGQMRGYWNDEETTDVRMKEGWILTGDIGRMDGNGFLYILDRKDDVIISGGLNIWPAELENAISNHSDVIEVAVFGIPDERWGETPAATCVVPEGASLKPEYIIELCSRELGAYKKPSVVNVTSEPLPRSAVGKIDRQALKEKYWFGHERRIAGA